jgi:ADP-heptose:LPS heptosyltransferase
VIHYLSLLSFGDNLISLALLAKLRVRHDVAILGTALTKQIAPFVPELDLPIAVISDGVPSFYDLRKRGVAASVRDALAVRHSIGRLTARGDQLILEKEGWRGRLLARAAGRRSWAPERRRNVYEDRRDVLASVLGEEIALEPVAIPGRAPRSVTINPASRVRDKAIAPRVLSSIVAHLRRRDVDVRLIDPEQEHGALRSEVSSYHTGTTLQEAVALVEASDLYMGADSLLVHFAYHRRTPVIVLYNETNLYFAPPGVEERNSFIDFVARRSESDLCARLDRLLSP